MHCATYVPPVINESVYVWRAWRAWRCPYLEVTKKVSRVSNERVPQRSNNDDGDYDDDDEDGDGDDADGGVDGHYTDNAGDSFHIT